jgi:hypothetical protein
MIPYGYPLSQQAPQQPSSAQQPPAIARGSFMQTWEQHPDGSFTTRTVTVQHGPQPGHFTPQNVAPYGMHLGQQQIAPPQFYQCAPQYAPPPQSPCAPPLSQNGPPQHPQYAVPSPQYAPPLHLHYLPPAQQYPPAPQPPQNPPSTHQVTQQPEYTPSTQGICGPLAAASASQATLHAPPPQAAAVQSAQPAAAPVPVAPGLTRTPVERNIIGSRLDSPVPVSTFTAPSPAPAPAPVAAVAIPAVVTMYELHYGTAIETFRQTTPRGHVRTRGHPALRGLPSRLTLRDPNVTRPLISTLRLWGSLPDRDGNQHGINASGSSTLSEPVGDGVQPLDSDRT